MAGGFLSFFLFSLPLLVLCSISTMKLSMNALYFCFAGLVRLFSCRFCLILRVCYFSHLSLLFRSFGRPVFRSFGRSIAVVGSDWPERGGPDRNEMRRDETSRDGSMVWILAVVLERLGWECTWCVALSFHSIFLTFLPPACLSWSVSELLLRLLIFLM